MRVSRKFVRRTTIWAVGIMLPMAIAGSFIVRSYPEWTTRPADSTARDLTAAEENQLYDAEQILVSDCMGRQGFRYQPVFRDTNPDHRDFPYVVDDVEWAGRHGYGNDIQNEIDSATVSDPNERYLQSLTADRRIAALTALNGLPSTDPRARMTANLPSGGVVHRSNSSCVSAAEKRLYGDMERWFRASKVADDLVGMRYGMVYADARFTRAVSIWSECMRQAGYAFSRPAEARDSFAFSSDPAKRDLEVRVAVAEATCATSTTLAATVRDLDLEYREMLRDRYRADFLDWQRLRLLAVPRARRILNTS